MEFVGSFIQAFLHYFHELWWSLAIGFFLSGLLYVYIPQDLVEKYLSNDGLQAILLASVIGMMLPVCCFGSLPIAVTLRNKGARLGPVLAFLVATPATSVSALIVCWKMLGLFFTVYIFLVVILMGVIIGLVGNALPVPRQKEAEEKRDCCHGSDESEKTDTPNKFKAALQYAFVTLPKEIGVELLIGVAAASFIIIFQPVQEFIKQYFAGAVGYVFIIIFGLLTYVCSTASVPLADAFIKSGMDYGHAMTYLLAGPITSYGTIFVMKKKFGVKVLGVYLVLVSILSLVFGIVFQMIQ